MHTQCFYLVGSWHKEAFKEYEEEEFYIWFRYGAVMKCENANNNDA